MEILKENSFGEKVEYSTDKPQKDLRTLSLKQSVMVLSLFLMLRYMLLAERVD